MDENAPSQPVVKPTPEKSQKAETALKSLGDGEDASSDKLAALSALPPKARQAIEQLPPEARQMFEFALSSLTFHGPPSPPFADKITGDHITTILAAREKESERLFEDSQANRKYSLGYFLIVAAVFVFLVVFLAEKNQALLVELITKLGVGLSLIAGGFGLKTLIDRKKS